MRPVLVLLLFVGVGVVPSLAQSFRVATWQVDRVPSLRAGLTHTLAEEQRFNEFSTALGATEADVIILYGLSESEGAKKVASLIKTRKYTVAHHRAFRHGGSKGPVVGQGVAILSRRETLNVKSVGWDVTGRIDLAGGFSFAAFRHGTNVICLYVANLPGSLTNGLSAADGKYYARKRNYAANYLAHHAIWLASTYPEPIVATYLTGDFQLAPKGLVNDDCAKILEAAGFRALGPGVAVDKTLLSITNSLEVDRVQDPVFTRGVEFIASRQINQPLSGFPIVVCELTLKNPATAKAAVKPVPPLAPAPAKLAPFADPEPVPAPPPPAVAAQALPKLTQAPATLRAQPEPALVAMTTGAPRATPALSSTPLGSSRPTPQGARAIPGWLWGLVAAAFASGLAFAPRMWSSRHRPATAPAVSRQANQAVYLEVQPAPLGDPQLAYSGDASVLRAAATATGHAEEIRWRKSEVSPESAALRARMMPQLKQMMREQLVAWLARQRSALLKSQEQGTEQVLDLQARLETIKEQFQQRMHTQQQRIAELDAALRAKEKTILDLLRSKTSDN